MQPWCTDAISCHVNKLRPALSAAACTASTACSFPCHLSYGYRVRVCEDTLGCVSMALTENTHLYGRHICNAAQVMLLGAHTLRSQHLRAVVLPRHPCRTFLQHPSMLLSCSTAQPSLIHRARASTGQSVPFAAAWQGRKSTSHQVLASKLGLGYPFSRSSRMADRVPDLADLRERGVKTSASAYSDGDASAAASSYPLTNVLASVAVACAGAFAFGYHLAVVNGPLSTIATDLGFAGNSVLQGNVVSATLAGAAIGSLTGGGLADALGRRKAFLLAAIPMIIGPLLSAWATGFNQMVIGRLVTGLALGLSSAVVPTYISEVAPTRLRGALGTLNQLIICVGILAVLVVGVVLPVTQWRNFFLLGALPGVLLLLGMLRSPESPRWLQSSGAAASAQAVARQLWGPAGASELGTGSATTGKPEAAVGLGDMFGSRFGRGVIMGIILFAIQQFAGINALVYFSTDVFRQAGVTSDTLASAAVGATNVLGTILAASIVEKAGRKQLLVNSYLGQASAMLLMAAGFTLSGLKDYAPAIAVGGTLLYILSFALGAGPITGLIVSEFNPGQIRGRAVAAAMTSHWVCNVLVGQSFMGAVSQYGLSSVYTAFGVVALLGAMYISSQVPETKGKTFDQIAAEMSK